MTGAKAFPLALALLFTIPACRSQAESLSEASAPAACAAPNASWATAARDPAIGDRSPTRLVQNVVALREGGQTIWNGEAATRDRVGQYLDITATMNPQPRLVVDIGRGASCAAAAELAREVERHITCTPRLCRWGV